MIYLQKKTVFQKIFKKKWGKKECDNLPHKITDKKNFIKPLISSCEKDFSEYFMKNYEKIDLFVKKSKFKISENLEQKMGKKECDNLPHKLNKKI